MDNIDENPRENPILSSDQSEKVEAIVQSPEAQEDFLKNQEANQQNHGQPEAEGIKEASAELKEHQMEDDSEPRFQLEKLIENEECKPEKMPQKAEEKLEMENVKHECNIREIQSNVQHEKKTKVDLNEPDEVITLNCPGPRVTEMDDVDDLETIHLSINQQLRIDDLPDLEDIEPEDFMTVLSSSQQVSKPKIVILSDSEDEKNGDLEPIASFQPSKKEVQNEATDKIFPLLNMKREDKPEPLLFQPEVVSTKHILIEELD